MNIATFIFTTNGNKRLAFAVPDTYVSFTKINQLSFLLSDIKLGGDTDYAGNIYDNCEKLIKVFLKREFGVTHNITYEFNIDLDEETQDIRINESNLQEIFERSAEYARRK